MALVTRLWVHKQTKDNATTQNIFIADGSVEHHNHFTNVANSWKRFFTPKQDYRLTRWAPTLSGIFKAGDEGLFSSALFTSLHGHPGDISLDALYDAFAMELRTHAMMGRSSYSGDLTKFIAEAKGGAPAGLGKTMSVSHKFSSMGKRDLASKSSRKSLDLSTLERGLVRGVSIKKPAALLVSMSIGLSDEGSQKLTDGSWMKDGQNVISQDGKRSIKVSPSELAALSIALGSPWGIGTERERVIFQKGAYGILLRAAPATGGKLQVTLHQQKCSISQEQAQGTGSSMLFARHMAAGSLPYSQDKKSVKSVLITNEAFEAIQAGASLYTHVSNLRTQQTRFLSSLPHSRDLSFHILAQSTEVRSSTTLIDAIAALPFSGGLTPLASTPLINTIRFIGSGGLHTARLLERLEGLVDKVHRQSPTLKIFGPLYESQNAGLLYRERGRLGKIATDPSVSDTLVDKTARVSRYITLLERLMALVPHKKPEDVLAAVEQATKAELQRAYNDAINIHANTDTPKSNSIVASHSCPDSDSRGKRRSILSTKRSDRSSTVSTHTINRGKITASPTSSVTSPAENLGRQVEQVLKMELPFSVETIAFVARMVIVAWTESVERVAWEKGETGFRVPDLGKLSDKLVLC